eukprot:12920625-Prorocentrum_lima.AAC.1
MACGSFASTTRLGSGSSIGVAQWVAHRVRPGRVARPGSPEGLREYGGQRGVLPWRTVIGGLEG